MLNQENQNAPSSGEEICPSHFLNSPCAESIPITYYCTSIFFIFFLLFGDYKS